MGRDQLIRLLGEHRDDVAAFGVHSLALFGSYARDEANPTSDVDFLVEFSRPPTSEDYFGLLFFLEDLLGRKVDLVSKSALKPRLRPYIESDLVHVA